MHIACRRLSAFPAVNRVQKNPAANKKPSRTIWKRKRKAEESPQKCRYREHWGSLSLLVAYLITLPASPLVTARKLDICKSTAVPALSLLLQPNLPPAIGKKFQYLTSRSTVILKPDSD